MITTIFSSSSLVPGILFGTLFAWLLASAAMTLLTGVKKPRAITVAPEKGQIAPANQAPQQVAEAPPAQPETASIAASADSR